MTVLRGGGRPDGGYRLADGTKIPGVTTPLGRFKDAQGMIWAANKLGLEGKSIKDEWYSGKATDIGSLVHDMIEAELNAAEPPTIPDEYRAQVESSFGAWQTWFESVRAEIVATELPLVSEEHRFGGTLDCIIRDKEGRLALADWKTSNAVYSEYLTQMAAYAILWNETQAEPLTGGYHLVRISKEHGDLEHRHFPALDEAGELFLLLLRAYELDKAVAKRAK